MATFDNASKAGDGVRAAANWLQALSERSKKAATGAAARAATGRGVEGAAKLAARGVDDAHLAFRDVLHTVEGQDVFRGLTPEAQNKIIANATETNRLLAEELKQVQSTEPGTKVRTFSARDSDAPSQEDVLRRIHGMRQELAPVSKTYDTQPTPKEDGIGTSRRLAGPTSKTVMKNAKTGEVTEDVANTPRPAIDNWMDRISRDTGGDIQTRTALPEVPGGDLRKVQEIKPGRYPGDIHSTLGATVNPAEINNLLAEVMTAHLNNPAAGILQPDELRALQPHFKSLAEKKKGEPEDQLTLGSVAKVVDGAFTRMRGRTDLSDSEVSLRDKGLAWQANQTLYKKGTGTPRYEASMEPYDKSEEQIALDRATAIMGTGVTSATPKTLRQAGGEAIAEGSDDLPHTAGDGARRSPPGSAQKLMESIQRGRSPIAQHLMTAENPDGTLKYPYQALNTALEDVARIEPNENWNSFEAAILRSIDYINENRKASGLPPADFGREVDAYIRQKSRAVEGKLESDGASPASDSVDSREAHRKRTFNALKGIRDGLEQMGAKNPVLHDGIVTDKSGKPLYYTLNPGTPVDPKTMSPTPTSNPAGDVMPGTARDPANVPPAPTNVQPKQGQVPVQAKHPNARPDATDADISTDKHIADVVAGKKAPTESLVEAVQARQNAIDAKRMRGDGVGADADQKALDAQTAGWNWKGTEAPAPKQDAAEALPEVPANIDLGTAKKGRQRRPKAETPTAAETPPPAAEPAKQEAAPPAPPAAEPAPAAAPTAAEPAQAKKRGRRTADATPVEPPAAAKPEPAKVPESRETMELAAKQMGMTPEEVAGMDDPSLYKRLTEKAASGQEPFKGGDSRFVKRKYRTGEVTEGENLPDIPSQEVLDAGSKGDLAAVPKGGSYRTGAIKDGENTPNAPKDQPKEPGTGLSTPSSRELSVPDRGIGPAKKHFGEEDIEIEEPLPEIPPEFEGQVINPRLTGPGVRRTGNPNTAPQQGPINVKPTHHSQVDVPSPNTDAAYKWMKRAAGAVTVGAGIGILKSKQGREPMSYDDIFGPVYHPTQDGTPPAQQDAGGMAATEVSPAPPAAPAAKPAPVDSPMTDAPREQQDTAALEAMKAEQIRQEVAARQAAVESTLRRIGNVRGMGTYGPAFY